jgi:hypothetical protein
MLKISKRFWSVFFILYVFTSIISAQTTENLSKLALDENGLSNFKKQDFSAEKKFEVNSAEKFLFQKTTDDKTDQNTSEAESYQLRRGEKQLNIELAHSPFKPTEFFIGEEEAYDTTGRSLGMVHLRWGRVIGTAIGITFEYQIEATPVALAFKNEVVNPAFQDAQTTLGVPPTIRRTTYGVGFSPVGFRFLFLPKKRLKPFISLHAGFVYFNSEVPVPNASTFNFASDYGVGVQYQIKPDKAISFGFKQLHISNVFFGEVNPGYNANTFYVGYSFFYK